MRKKIPFLIGLFLVINGLCSLYSKKLKDDLSQDTCAFCNPIVLTNQKFYEDDLVFALYTHKPILNGHCLIIPKRHVERFEGLSDTEVIHMSHIVKRVNQAAIVAFDVSSYLLLQKNGKGVGQSVPHVHIHYIPVKTGKSSFFKFLLKMWLANTKKPISPQSMQKAVEKMKISMESPSMS